MNKVMDNENRPVNSTLETSEKIIELKEEDRKPLVNKWVLISLIITLIISSVVSIYLFVQTRKESDVKQDENQAQEPKNDVINKDAETLGEITIDLGDGREIYISGIPHFYGEYRLVKDIDGVKIWKDNAEYTASTSYSIEYRESFEDFFEIDEPETVTVDGITYEYMIKEKHDTIDEPSRGFIINITEPVDINGFKAYETIDYYYYPTGNETRSADFEGTDKNKYTAYNKCGLINLKDIFPEYDGALLFKILGPYYSDIFEGDDFQVFSDEFSMEIRDRIVTDQQECLNLDNEYEYSSQIGDIDEDLIGSWHGCPSIGSGYCERYVFYNNGNYVFFHREVDKVNSTEESKESNSDEDMIVQGTWGVISLENGTQKLLTMAVNGIIKNKEEVVISPLQESDEDESPYPYKITIDNEEYWRVSSKTELWNPQTGEDCL
jgi:hypothetical protein